MPWVTSLEHVGREDSSQHGGEAGTSVAFLPARTTTRTTHRICSAHSHHPHLVQNNSLPVCQSQGGPDGVPVDRLKRQHH